MSKHGTTSGLWPGWYIEFQAKVLQSLPRDIGPDLALGWINNGEALRRALRSVLMPPDTFFVFVDRRLVFTELLRRAGFNTVDESFKNDAPEIRPSLGFGDQPPRALPIRLMKSEKGALKKDLFRRMTDLGLRPADLRELVCLSITRPDAMEKRRIVSLGSELPDGSNPVMGLMGSNMVLTSIDLATSNIDDLVFAAVELP